MPRTLVLRDLDREVHGSGYSAEQLCRVKFAPKFTIWAPGMICRTDGAHQRRHLVRSVTDMGLTAHPWVAGKHAQHYEISLLALGVFYADDRFTVSPGRTENQRSMYVDPGDSPAGPLGSFHLVIPVGDVKPSKLVKPWMTRMYLADGTCVKVPQTEAHALHAAGTHYWMNPVKHPGTLHGSVHFPAYVPSPQPPELILERFRIKRPGEMNCPVPTSPAPVHDMIYGKTASSLVIDDVDSYLSDLKKGEDQC